MTSPAIPSPKGESEQSPFEAFWDFLCPGIRCTPQDRAHYEPAVNKAVDAARRSTSSREEVRREALEEAAKVAEQLAGTLTHLQPTINPLVQIGSHLETCRVIATAIRALSQGE